MKYTVAIGASRLDTRWANTSYTWEEFVAELQRRFRRVSTTSAAYHAKPKSERVLDKDVGGYLTGAVSEAGRRVKLGVTERGFLALDADSQADMVTECALDLAMPGVAAVLHTSMTHTPAAPRQRVLVPLSRVLTSPAEHQALARQVAGKLGLERFDNASFDWNRLMFWPAATADGEYLFQNIKGAPLDVDAALAEYADWTDVRSWPRMPGDKPAPVLSGSIKKHPHELKGVAGAFCRAFGNIGHIVDTHLGHIYDEGSNEERRSLIGGDGADGLKFYAHASDPSSLQFATSHHTGHDPAAAHGSLNGFELCQVHLFGEMDEEAEHDEDELLAWLQSTGGTPSRLAALAWARELPEVAEELQLLADVVETQQKAEATEQQSADAERASRAEQKTQAALDQVAVVVSAPELERVLCPQLSGEDWSDGDLARLAKAVQDRFRVLTGSPLAVATARDWLRPPATTAAGAPDWIDRWVYVEEDKVFMSLDNKEMLAPPAFDARHTQAMPLRQGSTQLREPASVFAVHSWGLRTVSSTLYAPSKGEVFKMERRVWGNLFDPGSIPRTDDSITETGLGLVRMIESHMRRLVPDERERAILLSWMAHQVRSPGVKVRWAPYIWGPEGVGKSFLASVLDSCLGGRANVTRLGGRVLTSDFSGWSDGKAVTVIEEVYQAGHVYDVPEVLKTPITEDTISVHKKGKEAYDAPNFTNYLIFSNHADGIPVTESDRRYFFIETGISTEDARSLSDEGFFQRLFEAVRAQPGQLRRWMLDLPTHAEFEPNGRAPITAARAKAIELSKSEPEQLVEDLLAGQQVVSSRWLAKQAKDLGLELRTKALQKVLLQAGFEKNDRVLIEGVKHQVWTQSGWRGDGATLRRAMSWMRLAAFDDLGD